MIEFSFCKKENKFHISLVDGQQRGLKKKMEKGRNVPIWRCPQLSLSQSDGVSFSSAQLATALRASQLLEMGLNYSPSRCSFKDFVRFLQVLRYVRDEKMEDPDFTNIPVGCISLPQPAILANLQWSIVKSVPDCTDYTDRIYFALSTSFQNGKDQQPTRHIKAKEFRQFLCAVIRKVGSSAFNAADGNERLFRVAGDEHVVDAIADFEWRRLKLSPASGSSGAGAPDRVVFAQRLVEFALLLCSSTTSFAPHVPLLVLEVLDALFLPVALQISTRPEIVQRLQQSRGNISLLPAPSSEAPARCGAVVTTSGESVSNSTASNRDKTRDLFPRKRTTTTATTQPSPLPSPRQLAMSSSSQPTAALDGTREGLNGEAAVEELQTFLKQFAVQPNDDEQKRMDRQFLHREARKLLDTYPTQFKSITMTL